jgi:general secretion pathway protein L
MSLLIITLPQYVADKAALLDAVLSPDGLTVASHACVPLALLPAPDRQTEVVAVVPVQALSWHQVTLPQGSLPRKLMGERSKRLRAILEGILEDQLLDDVAQVHLALQPQAQVGTPGWVAACDRVWLQSALDLLSQAGYPVSRIVPESSPQALAQSIEVSGDADQPRVLGLVGAAGGNPPATSDGTRAGVLTCAMSAASVGLFSAESSVIAEPAVAALAEQLFQRPVILEQRGQRLLRAATAPWDLAQFEFTPSQRDPRWNRLTQVWQSFARAPSWRPARWALALLVMGQVVGLNAWALREQSLQKAQRRAVSAVLTDTFPKVPVVVDAPLQMAREVAALQRASGGAAGTDLESILASFSALAPVGYAPTAIEYAANELRLSGPVLAASQQAQLVSGLKALGLLASMQGDVWLIRPGVAP